MSTSTRLKGHVGIAVAGMMLAVLAALSILAVLPGTAQAQEEAEAQEHTGPTASVEAEQNSTTDDEKGASATTRLVVKPGDSLWSISEEHIGPGATPEQIAYEVQTIYELNRDQIGENPNLIFPGQEFFLVSAAPGGGGRAAATVVSEEPAVASGEPPTEAQTPASPTPANDIAWVDEEPPEGARLYAESDDEWKTVNAVDGMHQHFFEGASDPLSVNRGEWLFAYVYLDPANMPEEVMLQWNDGTGTTAPWEHRAYWGADKIEWGEDGTESRRYMGPLPAAGEWVRLEVSASEVGLEDREVHGMAFTLYGGRATWDVAGKAGSEAAVAESKSEGGVSQDEAVPAEQRQDSTDEQAESAPAESVPAESVAPATTAGSIIGSVLEAYNSLKGNRGLLAAMGTLALTLLIAIATSRAPRRKPSSPTGGPEGEPSGAANGSASGPPPEKAPREPSVSSNSTSPAANGAEEDVVAEGSAVAEGGAVAASAPGQEERLKRVRHLRRISQRRSPNGWRGG